MKTTYRVDARELLGQHHHNSQKKSPTQQRVRKHTMECHLKMLTNHLSSKFHVLNTRKSLSPNNKNQLYTLMHEHCYPIFACLYILKLKNEII